MQRIDRSAIPSAMAKPALASLAVSGSALRNRPQHLKTSGKMRASLRPLLLRKERAYGCSL